MAVEDVMKLKTLAVSGAAALLLVSSAAGAAADPGMQCELHHRHLIRVALSVAVGETRVDSFAVARLVDQSWEPEGVDIDWIDETQAATEARLDAWVVVGRTVAETAHFPPREDNLARRMVWISADEVVTRFEQRLSVQMQMPRESARHLLFGSQLLERALGDAIAHRIGHAVLGLSHAAVGLMSQGEMAVPAPSAAWTRDLDVANRKLLQKRFGVGCAAP
jgi:hypothetical protein